MLNKDFELLPNNIEDRHSTVIIHKPILVELLERFLLLNSESDDVYDDTTDSLVLECLKSHDNNELLTFELS